MSSCATRTSKSDRRRIVSWSKRPGARRRGVCWRGGGLSLHECRAGRARNAVLFWTGRARWSTDLPLGASTLGATYVQGAMVMFTRRALEAGVFMNEDLFIYYDEADVGFQLQHAHLRAYADPRVRVRHKNRVKFFNPRSGYLHQRNRVYIVKPMVAGITASHSISE